MKIHIIYDIDECAEDINSLKVAECVYSAFKKLPNVDIGAVSHLINVQVVADNEASERKLRECCSGDTEGRNKCG
jgi:hypothetical protein